MERSAFFHMENFIFALNAAVPVFLMIALGFFLQRVHFLNDAFNKTAADLEEKPGSRAEEIVLRECIANERILPILS